MNQQNQNGQNYQQGGQTGQNYQQSYQQGGQNYQQSYQQGGQNYQQTAPQQQGGQNYQQAAPQQGGQNYQQGYQQGGQNYQQGGQNYQQGGQNYQQPVPNPGPAPYTPPAPAPEKKKSKAPLIIIIVVAALLVAALAVGGFFLLNKDNDKDGKSTSEKADAIVCKNCEKEFEGEGELCPDCAGIEGTECKECGKKFTGEGDVCLACKGDANVSTIELYPDCEVDKKDLEGFAKLIEERAAILGDQFEITTAGDKLVLTIEKTLLGETAAERSNTVALLISRGTVSFSSSEYPDYDSPSKDNIKSIEVVELDKTDVLADYSTNFRDERYDQLELINDSTIYGIEITFSDEGAKKFGEVVEDAYEPKFAAVHDYLEDDSYDTSKFMGTIVLPDESDTSVINIISPAASYKKNAELMKKVLEQEGYAFGLVTEIADEPNWEVDGKHMGANQKTKMDGETIVAEFTPDKYTLSYRSEVEFAEYSKAIKTRLDSLGIDYMFGTSGFDDKTYCVRVKPQEFAPDFFRLIFGNGNVSSFSSFDSLSSFSSPEIIENGGKYSLRLDSYYSSDELLSQYNIPGNTVYLVINDVTIASSDVTQIVPDDDGYGYTLDFSNFLCFGDIEVSASEKNILDLLVAIDEGSYMGFSGTFRFRSFGKDGDENLSIGDLDWKYDVLTGEDKKVFQILTEMGYVAQKMVDSRNMLVITLDTAVDDNLAQNFLDEVKAIYEACGFDGGAYNEIRFVIKDETKESPANQFRLVAKKDTYDGKMEFSDYVSGPKFSEYWMDVYDIMEEDTFFVERSY